MCVCVLVCLCVCVYVSCVGLFRVCFRLAGVRWCWLLELVFAWFRVGLGLGTGGFGVRLAWGLLTPTFSLGNAFRGAS